ncbi:MAG: hypothetical protein SF187_21560 [Deltaproteobacteria bacterium]|nr:hypothetical protein [Deltaproteobacteria bacterium]
MPAGAKDARSLIERGLASYGRGDLPQALGLWREALQIDPGNEEARKLVSFVEERMSAKTPVPPKASSREPSPFPSDADDWSTNEGTAPGGEAPSTFAGQDDADADEGVRKRRQTLVSTLPELLAPSTLPENMRRTATVITAVPSPPSSPAAVVAPKPAMPAPPPKPAAPTAVKPVAAPMPPAALPKPSTRPAPVSFNDAVPQAPVADVITRPVGVEPPVAASRPPSRADTPLDLALAEARDRGKMLVKQVNEALAAGKNELAANTAEDLLQIAEKSPAPGIAEVIEPARSALERAFFAHLGRHGVPTMAVDDATVNASSFDHRTGFLLSCIDGTLPIETLIDISGMGRFEALRTLSRLLRRKIIKVG